MYQQLKHFLLIKSGAQKELSTTIICAVEIENSPQFKNLPGELKAEMLAFAEHSVIGEGYFAKIRQSGSKAEDLLIMQVGGAESIAGI